MTFHDDHNGCTSNGIHVDSGSYVVAPHYKLQSLDTDVRLYF